MNETKFKVGQAVVYTAPSGDSHSATVFLVNTSFVSLFWLGERGMRHTAMVTHKDAETRVVPFGQSMFLAL